MVYITVQGGEVLLRDGGVGTEQECCCGGGCSCNLQDLPTMTLVVEVSVSLPASANANDCIQSGAFTATLEFEADFSGDPYTQQFSAPLEFENGYVGQLVLNLYCVDGAMLASVGVYGSTVWGNMCGFANFQWMALTPDEGQLLPIGSEQVGEFCLPTTGTGSYYAAYADATVTATVTFTPLP